MSIKEKFNRLRNEDLIWIIYFFIAIFALLSNEYERNYLINHNSIYYQKEKTINITIFIIAFFIYFYFVLITTKDLNNMEKNFNNPKYRKTFIQLIAALLFLIGGTIYLYLETISNEPEDIGIIF